MEMEEKTFEKIMANFYTNYEAKQRKNSMDIAVIHQEHGASFFLNGIKLPKILEIKAIKESATARLEVTITIDADSFVEIYDC